MQNYLIGALRGTPGGKGKLAVRLRQQGRRLPLVLPRGQQYLGRRFQFVHVDDMARLIAHILRRPTDPSSLVVLNVAGRGDSLPIGQCARIAEQKLLRLPGEAPCRWLLQLMWKLGVSSVPPDALPYMVGSYLMDTSRLRAFLGSEYEQVIRYTVEAALRDSFAPAQKQSGATLTVQPRTSS